MRVTVRHAVSVIFALLMACSIAACGGDSVALDPVAEAATKTSDAKSMRIEMRMTIAGSGFGSKPVAVKTSGVATGNRSAMTMRMPAIDGRDLGEFEVRADGLVLYLRMPFLQAAAPDLKPWIKIDLRKAAKDIGLDLDALMELGTQTDPTKALDFLKAAGEVEEVGKATVRGVETTRYKAVIDLERYAAELERNGGGKAAATSVRKAIELTGKSTMPIEVWIGEDSLVRRMTWEQQVSAGTGQAVSTVKATMDLFDYGANVEVVIPRDDQTSSFDELEKLGAGG
jgi:hypothetical protein